MRKRMIGICAGLGFFGAALGQQMAVPVNIQYQLMAKSLPYVKFLATKPEGICKVALIYQSKNRMSVEAKTEFESLFTSTPFQFGVRPVEIVPVDLSGGERLEDRLNEAMMAFITPLRAIETGKIVTLCKMMNVLSISSLPDDVKKGVVMGFDVEASKPKILVNLKIAEQSGISFSADYLKLVRIVE